MVSARMLLRTTACHERSKRTSGRYVAFHSGLHESTFLPTFPRSLLALDRSLPSPPRSPAKRFETVLFFGNLRILLGDPDFYLPDWSVIEITLFVSFFLFRFLFAREKKLFFPQISAEREIKILSGTCKQGRGGGDLPVTRVSSTKPLYLTSV